MPPTPQTAKLTSTLHLLIPRLRLLQKKSTASSVVQRRELSHLLSEGRDASARIRVENVIATDIAVEVMEMVELYCELLLARANVLDQLAFGEKGVQARNHARDVALSLKRETMGAGGPLSHSNTATTSSSGGGGGGGGGLFSKLNPFTSTPTPTQPHSQSHSQSHLPSTPPDETNYLDPALDEASAAIFYAWSRFPSDVRELTILRTLLADRYGKDFMALAQDNKFPETDGLRVPERLVKGLRVRPPTAELVESYLAEIARAYGVAWGGDLHCDSQGGGGVEGEVPPAYFEGADASGTGTGAGDKGEEEKGDGDGDGGQGDIPTTPVAIRQTSTSPAELNRATPPRGPLLQSGKSPVSVAPPGPRSDNPNPRVKVPGGSAGGNGNGNNNGSANANEGEAAPSKAKGGGIPELDELTRRFAALRK